MIPAAAMITVQGMGVRFGNATVVDGVSFSVGRGESFALVGESGSGKSTILRVLAGLVKDWSGHVAVAGSTLSGVRRPPELIRQVQMVFQDPYGSLHPRRTVDDALTEPLVIHRIADRDARVLAMLDAVGLPRRLRFRLPHQMSGGQRQRLAIARALMLEPAVLLLDEPTSALDVSVQAEILNLLKSLRTERGLTTVLVAHDLPVAAFLCDRVGVLHLGRLEEVAEISALRQGALASASGRELVARSLRG